MTVIGVALALLSSVTTATAHALLKSGKDKLAIRGIIGATGAIVALPICFIVPLPTRDLTPWLFLSSLLHTLYQLALIRSYDLNGFATAFPWARGIAPLSVMLISVGVLGDRISALSMAGILVVSAGLVLVAGVRSVAWRGLAAATLTGMLTAIYTIVDAHGVRLAHQAMTFVVWFFVLDGVIMFPVFAISRKGQVALLLAAEGRQGVIAGIMSLVSFGSALLALRLIATPTVSALREISVVAALFIAAAIFKEEIGPRRSLGAVLCVLGAILIIYRPA